MEGNKKTAQPITKGAVGAGALQAGLCVPGARLMSTTWHHSRLVGRDPSNGGKDSFNHVTRTAGDPHGFISHHTQKLTRTRPERDFPSRPVLKNLPCNERHRGSTPAHKDPTSHGPQAHKPELESSSQATAKTHSSNQQTDQSQQWTPDKC